MHQAPSANLRELQLAQIKEWAAQPVKTPSIELERATGGVHFRLPGEYHRHSFIPLTAKEANDMAMALRLAARHMDLIAKTMRKG